MPNPVSPCVCVCVCVCACFGGGPTLCTLCVCVCVCVHSSVVTLHDPVSVCLQLKRLMECCCRRKKFLQSMNKMISPCMLLALRENEAAMDVSTTQHSPACVCVCVCVITAVHLRGVRRGKK